MKKETTNFMEQELYKKIEELEIKINKMYATLEAAKKMFMWSLIITLILFVVPLIILMFILPSTISNITSAYSGLL